MSRATERTGVRFSSWALAAGVALALTLLPLFQQPANAQVHPFYNDALQAGVAAYDRGDFAKATERLRIAGFGMLDQPQLLAETLVRLGLAQAAAGQRDDFLATFDRISQTEELFNAYSNSRLPGVLTDLFEEQVTRWVPASTLEQSTAFAQLFHQQELLRLRNMLPAARTAALEQMAAAHPGDLGWGLMLATARIESGAGAAAVAALEDMVVDRPASSQVACLLGRAYLQSGSCEPVLLAPLETVLRCDIRRLPAVELAQYLECLTDAERWLEAASVVVSLPPERRAGRPFRRWEKRIARQIEPGLEVERLPPYQAQAEDAAPSPEPTRPPARQSKAGSTIAPLANVPPDLPSAELESLRRLLAAARTVKDLQAVTAAGEDLKRRHPQASEALHIAGEAAYRASRWQLAADYLRTSGGPPDERYDLLFYLSVSLYELGDRNGARQSLLRALPGLEATPLVNRYQREILGSTQQGRGEGTR